MMIILSVSSRQGYEQKERIRWKEQNCEQDCMCEGSEGRWFIRGRDQ